MKFIRNFSIKNKLILIVLLVCVPSLVIGFSFIIITDVIQMRKDLVSQTQMEAGLIGENCVAALDFADGSGTEDILKKLTPMQNIEYGFVFNAKNELTGSYSRGNHKMKRPDPINKEFNVFERDYLYVFQPILSKGENIGSIIVIASTESLQRSIINKIISLVLVMFGLIVLSFLLALKLQGMISLPILKLARVTEKISNQSDLSFRVKKEGEDEIGVLYDGFNNMLEQIQVGQKKRDEAEAEQKRLLDELAEKNKELEQVIYVTSHDLRSPLVNIQGFSQELGYSLHELDMILNDIEEIPKPQKDKLKGILYVDIQESLKYIEASTSKMDGLLSGLLKLSRVDRMVSTFENIDMKRLLADIVNSVEFQLKESGATIQVNRLPSCFGNEMQVNQVFSNLLNNALKYLDPNRPGIIKISGEENSGNNCVIYCVEDNGIGIPKEYHKKIFEIFHRLNPDETEGEGLGLAIVSKIITRHKGNIWLESQAGKGTKFFVSLPLVNGLNPPVR